MRVPYLALQAKTEYAGRGGCAVRKPMLQAASRHRVGAAAVPAHPNSPRRLLRGVPVGIPGKAGLPQPGAAQLGRTCVRIISYAHDWSWPLGHWS